MTNQYKYTCHHFADAALAGTPARIESHNGGTVILEFSEGSRLEIPTSQLVDLTDVNEAIREAKATLGLMLERLEVNDYEGEEEPFMQDCLTAITLLENVRT